MIDELKGGLAALRTLEVLDCYQLGIDLAGPNPEETVPDGYLFKWRYVWALLLSQSYREEGAENLDCDWIDQQIEKIFEVYELGAVFEPGWRRGSLKEFLTRLGFAAQVRETDALAFPEQIHDWAVTRFEPFDSQYFLPVVGLRSAEIFAWLTELIREVEKRLNSVASDLAAILVDVEEVQSALSRGVLDDTGVRERLATLNIRRRLEENRKHAERVHIFLPSEIGRGITQASLSVLIDYLSIVPGKIVEGFTFPHDENPLECATFVLLPEGSFYFLDPGNCYRVVAKRLEREFERRGLIERYLHVRDRRTEEKVRATLRKVFPSADIFHNYYLQRGQFERDIFVREGNSVLLVECKNSKVRPFKGTRSDVLNIQRDFKNSVQYGYRQACEVRSRILSREETTFLTEKGQRYFSVTRSEIKEILVICVTLAPLGPFGTDLSLLLEKAHDQPFPFAVNLYDLETICKYFNEPEKFLGYLRARQTTHGKIHTRDELNLAGYFYKFGNVDLQEGTVLMDDFSHVFDREWYRERGLDVEEPQGTPVISQMRRIGNRIDFEILGETTEKDSFRIDDQVFQAITGKPVVKIKGRERNRPWPCGSGLKYKNCHGR